MTKEGLTLRKQKAEMNGWVPKHKRKLPARSHIYTCVMPLNVFVGVIKTILEPSNCHFFIE